MIRQDRNLITLFFPRWLPLSLLLCIAGLVGNSRCPAQQLPDQTLRNAELYSFDSGMSGDRLLFAIRQIIDFEPRSLAEYRLHVEQGPAAVRLACESLLEQNTDETSLLYHQARLGLIAAELIHAHYLDSDGQNELVATINQTIQDLQATPSNSQNSNLDTDLELLSLAFRSVQAIEHANNVELAIEAGRDFGQLFSASDNPRISASGRRMMGISRRLQLVGQSLELSGTDLSGEPFDLSNHRGQPTLVYFWTTVAGPVDAEFLLLKQLSQRFGEDNFRIILINLDEKTGVAQEYLEKKSLDWTCLFEANAGWDNAIAVEFGIDQIPSGILTDEAGIVVSTKARGTELERLLDELLGSQQTP